VPQRRGARARGERRGSAAIARALAGRGAHVVLLSTNGVFDGAKPFRAASDVPDGATVYGRSKALAEAKLRAIDPRAAVLRLTRVFVPGEPLLVGWAEKLRAGEPVEAFADLVAAPDPRRPRRDGAARDRARAIAGVRRSRRGASDVRRDRAARRARGRRSPDLVRPVAAAARGIGPGEAPRHASLACDDFAPRADRAVRRGRRGIGIRG
jgi:dTDP-4-dehydrorhamnose reductase